MANILIVDRQPTNREVRVALFGYGGHYHVEASDGSGTLEITRAPFEPEQVWSVVGAALDREHLGLVTYKRSQKAAGLRLANLRFRSPIELGRESSAESNPSALVLSDCRATREIVAAGLSLIRLNGPARPVFTSFFHGDSPLGLIDSFKS